MPPRLASAKISCDWGRKGPFRFWRIFCQSRVEGWFLAAACGPGRAVSHAAWRSGPTPDAVFSPLGLALLQDRHDGASNGTARLPQLGTVSFRYFL